MKKCSGARCPMQAGKFNVSDCKITDDCPYFTEEIKFCEYCKVFKADYEHDGKQCCVFCKRQIEMSDRIKKIEAYISEKQ